MTSEPDAQPLADDELEHARRRQADPLVQVSQTERLLLQEVDRLRAVAEEHRQSARHSHYDVEALLLERERMEGELSRLRAENTTQAGQLDAIQALRGRWAAVTEAEATPSWDISRRHEHLAAWRQLQHCAQQLGDVIDAVAKLQDHWNAATTPPSALGLVQDGKGQADAGR